MDKKRKIVPLQELNLTNRFLFDEVLEDPDAHQDVFSIDEESTVHNTEMQQKKRGDLVKRSRYYQSMVDTSLMEPGVPDYNQLNSAFIIMIMTFDLFGYDKYMYTFKPRCVEVPECALEDGAVRIFLNTRGRNKDEVSKELAEFLYYLENTNEETAANTSSERIRRIHQRVRQVKTSEEAGVRYMQAWEERYYEREEARNEGIEQGIEQGLEQGMRAMVLDYMEEGFDKNKILKKLQKRFEVSAEKAEEYYEKFRKE